VTQSPQQTGILPPGSGRDGRRSVVVVFAVLGSFFGLLFSRLSASRLPSQTSADLRALFGGLSAVGFLVTGVQLTLVGAFGRLAFGDRLLARRLELRFFLFAAGMAVVAGLGAGIFVDADLGYRAQVGAGVAVAVAAMFASSLPRAELLNGENWLRLGCVLLVGPVVRLAVGAIVLSGTHPSRNIVPVVVAECVAGALAFALRPARYRTDTGPTPSRNLLVGATASIGLLASLAALSVGFRARLGAGAAVFNDSSALGRSIAFLPLTVSVLYLPALARSALGSTELHRAYLGALGWTASLATAAGVVIIVAPERLADAVLGSGNASSASVIRLLALAWVFTSVAIVPLMQYVAHGSRLALLSWGPVIIIAGGQLLARSAQQLALVALVSSGLLFVLLSVPALLRVQPVVHAVRAEHQVAIPTSHAAITVVIPCYNAGSSVQTTIRDVAAHLTSMGMHPSIIVVSDGSTDGSDQLIDEVDVEHVVHIRHEVNRGKGAALRTGFAAASSELVAFIDADGDLSPSLLGSLVAAQQLYDADIVFGSKLHPESMVDASRLRRLYSDLYQRLIRLLFQLDVRDTQTGIKVIRRDVLVAVLPTLREEGFALDLELFIASRANGYTNFVEVPVVLSRVAGSTISVRAIRRMIADTFRLFWRAKVTLGYLRSSSPLDNRGSPAGDRKTTANADRR
jgi:hypothetical protein